MNRTSTFLIQSTIFDRKHLLTIDPDFLSFDDNALAPEKPKTFTKEDIESYRFAVDWVWLYGLVVGRSYRIEIRNHKGQTIRLRLRSLYGVRKRKLGEKYIEIIKTLQNVYFEDILMHYVKLLGDGLTFPLAGIILSPDGISDPKMGLYDWRSLSLKSFATYFALHDINEPKKYRPFDYGIDWNASILYSVLDYEIKRRKLK